MKASPVPLSPQPEENPIRSFTKICLFTILFSSAFFIDGIPSAKGISLHLPERSPMLADLQPASSPPLLSKRRSENAYDNIIMEAARRHDVHPALIKAIIKAESSYNPRAVSKKGARGLMQLMPGTARAMGVKNSFNPRHNIHGGTKYFKHLLDEFGGNIRLALAAYNAGIQKVRKYGSIPPYKATRSYIRKVISYYREYRTEMRMLARS